MRPIASPANQPLPEHPLATAPAASCSIRWTLPCPLAMTAGHRWAPRPSAPTRPPVAHPPMEQRQEHDRLEPPAGTNG
nr:unnamed protein product [Digitaria exilis]